jgi:nucleoside-diphosphate-sugar epimerase
MRILILGGTSFVGRAIVAAAQREGHDLTIFSRGRTGADLFPEVPRLVGDRDSGDYAALTGTTWDAVVDVSGYLPRQVRDVIDVLGDDVARYLFISTISVYDRTSVGPDLTRLPPEHSTEEITSTTYGPLKVACEDTVLARYANRATIVRPGIVAGPHDPTDRFTYWVRRAAAGGKVLLAGAPDAPIQVVDSRDLAQLVLALIRDDRPGTFDATGPEQPVTLGQLIRICAAAAGSEVDLVTVAKEVVGAGVLPLVMPEEAWPLYRRSADAARAAGMPSTPLSTTAADVLAWDRERGEPPLGSGLDRARESQLLAAHGG